MLAYTNGLGLNTGLLIYAGNANQTHSYLSKDGQQRLDHIAHVIRAHSKVQN